MPLSGSIMAFLATQDAARALTFFRDVLGLRLLADEPFALVFDANGTMLRVSRVERLAPAPYTVLGWRVTDLGAAVRDLAARGVRFERFAGMEQDPSGVWTSPSGATVAWFKDPDGNVLSLTQFPEGSGAG
jgi:catechol 2,3-dioxygenase-like lactoylglutathione lyase family enzyme